MTGFYKLLSKLLLPWPTAEGEEEEGEEEEGGEEEQALQGKEMVNMQHLGNKWGVVQPTQQFAKGKVNSFYPDVCLNRGF